MRKYKGSTLILLLFDNEHSFNLPEEFSLFKSIIKFRVTERKVAYNIFFFSRPIKGLIICLFLQKYYIL